MILDLALVVAIAFIISLVVCGAMIWIGPRDAPNEERKQHLEPTPTSGGIGIGAGFGAGMTVLSLFSFEWRHEIAPEAVAMLWVAALFAYPLLLVGFVDDARRLSTKFKFAVYVVLSVTAAWLMGVVDEVSIGPYVIQLPVLVALAGTGLWVFTVINVVNFMDGANGMAMGCVAIGLIALALIALEGGSIGGAAMSLCCAGALAGFLVWNFPSGRLFAGDSGALFAGAIAAFACLIVISRAHMSPLLAPILFFPMLADTLLTLIYRLHLGRKILDAHNEHLYQIAIRSGWSHANIVVVYWLAMVICGGIAIHVSNDPTNTRAVIALGALSVGAIALSALVRGRARVAGTLKP